MPDQVKSTAAASCRTAEQELWEYKHTLSCRIQRPLVELNMLLAEAAEHGVIVNLKAENVNLGLGYDPVPSLDLSVFSPL
jgi:hypothetical protein